MKPRLMAWMTVIGLVTVAVASSDAQAQWYGGGNGGYGGGYAYGGGGYGAGYYGDPYSYGSTFEYVGGPCQQVVSHTRYIDARTFRHHVFENVTDQRVIHTGEYRRTRISGDVYTPSYRMARRMYQYGR